MKSSKIYEYPARRVYLIQHVLFTAHDGFAFAPTDIKDYGFKRFGYDRYAVHVSPTDRNRQYMSPRCAWINIMMHDGEYSPNREMMIDPIIAGLVLGDAL